MFTILILILIALIVSPLALLMAGSIRELTPKRREARREAELLYAAHQARRDELALERHRAAQLRHEAKRAEYQIWLDKIEADPQLKLSMPNTYANARAYLNN